MQAGHSFASETVFSHVSKLELIKVAQRHGFVVVLLVVCMDDPERLRARVQQRVLEGGHHVPSDRILTRYPRTLKNLTQAVRLADMAMLYDSGGARKNANEQLVRVAVCRGQETKQGVKVLPQWAAVVLARA